MVKPKSLVQTIERVSAIIDLIGESRDGTSIKDASSKLALPKGTVHRLLSSLAYCGYVRQDVATRNYFLGLKLLRLGGMASSQLDVRGIARPHLQALAEKNKETVHMVVWDEGEVVYIDKVESSQRLGGLRMTSKIGGRNPAHSSAVGKLFLSRLADDELGAFISLKGLPERTARTIHDEASLRQELQAIRQQGYAVDDEENEKGIRCVGALVLDNAERPVAAVSVSGPTVRVTKEAIRDVLRKQIVEAALEISRKLGYREA
ncbi:MAG: IclR family transcriptional regulator [Syntrophorhabdales bacterium]|jgi:DNA-binding IclR family transcriptional regulator